jgi:hypothetical protein
MAEKQGRAQSPARPQGNALLAAIARAADPGQAEPQPSAPAPAATQRAEAKPVAKPSPRARQGTAAAVRRPGRAATRLIAGHFDAAVARQLRLLAAEEDTTIQSLLSEALDLLFVKKGKARIAALLPEDR